MITYLCVHFTQTICCSFELMEVKICTWLQMLFEEQGSFLEIVDIIGGFGLNVLKGKMEIRDTKIWARFIVEVC